MSFQSLKQMACRVGLAFGVAATAGCATSRVADPDTCRVATVTDVSGFQLGPLAIPILPFNLFVNDLPDSVDKDCLRGTRVAKLLTKLPDGSVNPAFAYIVNEYIKRLDNEIAEGRSLTPNQRSRLHLDEELVRRGISYGDIDAGAKRYVALRAAEAQAKAVSAAQKKLSLEYPDP